MLPYHEIIRLSKPNFICESRGSKWACSPFFKLTMYKINHCKILRLVYYDRLAGRQYDWFNMTGSI